MASEGLYAGRRRTIIRSAGIDQLFRTVQVKTRDFTEARALGGGLYVRNGDKWDACVDFKMSLVSSHPRSPNASLRVFQSHTD